MTRRVAILGLGATGGRWSRVFHKAGWSVAVFDPDPGAEGGTRLKGDWKRHETISATVHGADWVMVCLPERLDLIRTVIQRAQSEAPRDAVVVTSSTTFDIEEVQGCALRPGDVVRIEPSQDGGISLQMTSKNSEEVRAKVKAVLPELAAVVSLEDPKRDDDDQSGDDAISA